MKEAGRQQGRKKGNTWTDELPAGLEDRLRDCLME